MRDVAAAIRGVARALPLAIAAPEPEPTLALVEGPSQARAGEDTAYRVRVYNPTAGRRSIDVAIAGWRDGDPGATFRLEWTAHLEPMATEERWVQTDWRGRAVLLERSPDGPPAWSGAGETSDRWHVEASLRGASPLRASGDIVA